MNCPVVVYAARCRPRPPASPPLASSVPGAEPAREASSAANPIVYVCSADAEPTAHLDLLAVCTRAPRAVVCGESALSLHELIDDIPHEVHIAVSRGSHRPSISYPPTKVSQYAADTFDFAVERFEVAPGETVPLYSAARAVVDAMRLGRAEGRSLALSALNRYLRRTGQQGVADLQQAARELGGMSALRPAIEAVLA